MLLTSYIDKSLHSNACLNLETGAICSAEDAIKKSVIFDFF